jgi:hypothetical protein
MAQGQEQDDTRHGADHPLMALMGGTRGALEAVLPPLAFITVYLALGGDSSTALLWAIGVAVLLSLWFAGWRVLEGKKPVRALGSLLFVLVSGYIASRTGSAADFFWPRALVNAASGLAFVVANLARWPLIGVVIGPLVGTRMTWRKDPDLVRAYAHASWPFAVLNFVRAGLLVLFIGGDNLWALAASGAVFYGLTFLTIAVSWWLLRRALPADHLGIRHPHVPA